MLWMLGRRRLLKARRKFELTSAAWMINGLSEHSVGIEDYWAFSGL